MSKFNLSMARLRRSPLALLIVFALILASCGDDGFGSAATSSPAAFDSDVAANTTIAPDSLADVGDTSQTTMAPATTVTQAAADSAANDASTGDTPGLAVPTALTPADIGRDIVFRATIDVEVEDVAAAGAEARNAVVALGGIVFGESTTTTGLPRTVLTFKVQPVDFDAALAAISRIGELVDQQISADDVTDRVVDLQSRVTTAESSVERLRNLLDQAGDINILASLENQLLDRETLLEQLRGQLRTLRDQVSLATITLSITQAPTVIPPAAIDLIAGLGTDRNDACPGSLELSVDGDKAATICVEIENIGESALTDVRVESGQLRLRLADFTIIEGDPTQLEPGGRLVAAIDLDLVDGLLRRRDATQGIVIDIQASADPIDSPNSTIESSTAVTLVANSSNPLPGFGDSLSAGTSALALVGSLLLIVIGGGLPFVPILVIIAVIAWWRRRRFAWVEHVEPVEPLDQDDQDEK